MILTGQQQSGCIITRDALKCSHSRNSLFFPFFSLSLLLMETFKRLCCHKNRILFSFQTGPSSASLCGGREGERERERHQRRVLSAGSTPSNKKEDSVINGCCFRIKLMFDSNTWRRNFSLFFSEREKTIAADAIGDRLSLSLSLSFSPRNQHA